MARLFISYRRNDSIGITGRIYDRLQTHFGQASVFMDVDSVPLGVDFRRYLTEAVSRCDALLAIIGDQWIEVRQQSARRLDDPGDFVRIEIEAALTHNLLVIPVLIGRAAMPRADKLPPSLAGLAYRNAAHVDPGRDFHAHMNRLIRDLDSLLKEAAEATRRRIEEERRSREEAEAARRRAEKEQQQREQAAAERRHAEEEQRKREETESIRRRAEEEQQQKTQAKAKIEVKQKRWCLYLAGVSGFLVIALALFGTIGLRSILQANSTLGVWEKAIFYHAFHTIALLILAMRPTVVRGAVLSFIGGILLFSGCLYLLAVTNMRWLGALTPLGAMSLLAGWAWLFFTPGSSAPKDLSQA